MNARQENNFWTGVAGFLVVALIALGSLGIRWMIAGPECFWATDVGVCQAIREVGE